MRTNTSFAGAAVALLAAAPALFAQTPAQVASVANALEWREVGPTIVGGRISDLAVVERDRWACETISGNKELDFPLVSQWPVTDADVRDFAFES